MLDQIYYITENLQFTFKIRKEKTNYCTKHGYQGNKYREIKYNISINYYFYLSIT